MYNQELLKELTKVAIAPAKRERTLFDISGTAHNENVISNWYKYFLNPMEDHGLGSTFVDALLEFIDSPFTLQDFKVRTEVATKKGNRIDVLIAGKGDDDQKYIIIESKIYHHLHNDLLDYWKDIENSKNKVGVLLTLKPEKIPENVKGHFKNVLHKDWIDVVANRINNNKLSVSQDLFFSHFYHTINNLNRYNTLSESSKFYFKNIESINTLIECKTETGKFIIEQLKKTGKLLDLIELGSDQRMISFSTKLLRGIISYGVIFEKLFSTEREIRIIVGLDKKYFNRVAELDTVFAEEVKKNGLLLNAYKGLTWHNYLTKVYTVDEDILGGLAEFVKDKINADFKPFADRIGEYLLTVKVD